MWKFKMYNVLIWSLETFLSLPSSSPTNSMSWLFPQNMEDHGYLLVFTNAFSFVLLLIGMSTICSYFTTQLKGHPLEDFLNLPSSSLSFGPPCHYICISWPPTMFKVLLGVLICLSLNFYSPGPFKLLQMVKFHSFHGWVVFHCVCVCVYLPCLSIHLLMDT